MDNNNPYIMQLSKRMAWIATEAVQRVVGMLAGAWQQGGFQAEEKAPIYDLVTRYDREVEEALVSYILKQCPECKIVGEETGWKGNEEGFILVFIDPIDGTANFASKQPFIACSIGVSLNDRLIAGVVLDPLHNEIFSASLGEARLNGVPIRTRSHMTDAKALLLTNFPHPEVDVFEDDYALYAKMIKGFRAVRRPGAAALELAHLACGRADVYFNGNTFAWDVAAGRFIVEQAGGTCIPLDSHGNHPAGARLVAFGANYDIENSVMKAVLPTSFHQISPNGHPNGNGHNGNGHKGNGHKEVIPQRRTTSNYYAVIRPAQPG